MKNILITGGTKGLGLEITNRLIMKGYKVFTLARHITNELDKLLNEQSEFIKFIQYDLENVEDIKKTIFNSF